MHVMLNQHSKTTCSLIHFKFYKLHYMHHRTTSTLHASTTIHVWQTSKLCHISPELALSFATSSMPRWLCAPEDVIGLSYGIEQRDLWSELAMWLTPGGRGGEKVRKRHRRDQGRLNHPNKRLNRYLCVSWLQNRNGLVVCERLVLGLVSLLPPFAEDKCKQ